MSKYRIYAQKIDEAFRAARDEYKSAYDELEALDKKRVTSGTAGSVQRQRAELDYKDAQRKFKSEEDRIWGEFNQRRSELRRELVEAVSQDRTASPDAVDEKALALLNSGIMDVRDFYSMEEKYSDNPTMLRLLGQYARKIAEGTDIDRSDRGALYMLADRCKNAQGGVVNNWDALSKIADYCSGQSRERRDSPAHTVNMGNLWEQLSGDMVSNF